MIAGTLFGVGLVILMIAAWLTHVFTCFITAAWGFLKAGAIVIPIGILHGLY